MLDRRQSYIYWIKYKVGENKVHRKKSSGSDRTAKGDQKWLCQQSCYGNACILLPNRFSLTFVISSSGRLVRKSSYSKTCLQLQTENAEKFLFSRQNTTLSGKLLQHGLLPALTWLTTPTPRIDSGTVLCTTLLGAQRSDWSPGLASD